MVIYLYFYCEMFFVGFYFGLLFKIGGNVLGVWRFERGNRLLV